MNAGGKGAADGEERRRQLKERHDRAMLERKRQEQIASRQRRMVEQAQRDEEALQVAALDELAREIGGKERAALIRGRRDEHRLQLQRQSDEAERKRVEASNKKWAQVRKIAEDLSEISVSWEDLRGIPDEIFDTEAKCEIISLNLVGIHLPEIPDRVAETFTSLRQLTVDSNELEELPASLCRLPELRRISAVRNRIARLPRNIGLLRTLRVLSLPNNKLQSLPASFNNLHSLQELVLEHNDLEEIPPMGDLPLKKLNLSSNKLTTLVPLFQTRSGELEIGKTLEVLSANWNLLETLPARIGEARELREVYICQNRLRLLPKTIGRCTAMERFWIDWNQVEEVPVTIANWDGLRDFKAEGNPIGKPPPELIFDGHVKQLVSWCKKYNVDSLTQDHKGIIEDLQRSLSRITLGSELYESLCDIFEPDVQALPKNPIKTAIMLEPDYDDGGVPRFYVFVLEALFTRILPALQPEYEALSLIPGAQEALGGEFFLHSREALLEAITEYDDAYGPVGALYKEGQFRRCSCVDGRGRRRVCIPPGRGMMCTRKPTVWVRMQLTTRAQFREHEMRRHELKTIHVAVKDCKKKCELFLESRLGRRHVRRRAKQLARESRATRRAEGSFAKQQKKDAAKSSKRRERRKKRLAKLRARADKERTQLEREREECQEKLSEVFGQVLEEVEARIEEIDELLTQENALAGADLEEYEELKQEDEDSDDAKEEQIMEKELEELEEPDAEELAEIAEQKRHNRMTWRELLRECRQAAAEEYTKEQCDAVRKRITEQYVVMRRVMKDWLGTIVKNMFETWKEWAMVRIKARREKQAESEQRAKREAAASEATKTLEAMEAAKWIEKFDEFSDRVFFEHCETGEIAWDEKPKRGFVLR